jgi:hypothetical protein
MESTMKTMTVLLLALLCATAAGSAWAHGRGPRVGVYVGVPFGYYWYGPPSYYYYPPPVVIRQEPQVYIERAAPQAQSYWYYCAESAAYYPYVKECPGGWQRVVPTPPSH